MNALAVLSTFLLGEAQNEAWNDENNGGGLSELLEEILGEDASAEAFDDEDSFDEFGDEELIALAAAGGLDSFDEFGGGLEADEEAFDEFGDDKLIEMAAGEFDDDDEWEDFGPAGRRREEEGDDRRRAVRMSSLGFGVCRTASGGAGRYKSLRTATQEQCRAQCMAETACLAFEYTFMSSPINPGWCEIHYERITKKVFTRTNMCEVKIGTPTPVARMSSLGFGVCRTASGGAGRYRGYNSGTQEKCRARCLADRACVAFEFTFMSSPVNPGWCEIHYERITQKIATRTNMCEVKVGGRRLDDESLLSDDVVEMEN